ncbi:unnamed protein product [Penicillium glandicola]
MSTENVQGYALRHNNTCISGTQSCTPNGTWDNWQACCPENSYCFDSTMGQANMICCPNGLNCSATVAATPACADTSWNLFNSTGYFCCESGQDAFNVEGTVLVGCADADFAGNSSYLALSVSSVGTPSATATATSTSTSTSSSTPTSSTTTAGSVVTNKSSHSNTGAIAGGVVGGVAGAAAIFAIGFFFLRRRKQKAQPLPQEETYHHEAPLSSPPSEMYAGKDLKPNELDGQAKSELALGDHPIQEPQELPAHH